MDSVLTRARYHAGHRPSGGAVEASTRRRSSIRRRRWS